MPELTSPPNTPQSGTEPDPFATLYKMSTTAGIGGGSDYVAVNALSVAAILLGIGSGMALMSNLFLLIPLTGVVCAIFALKQIRQSNGTQTGSLLAIGGLILSLAFAGWVGAAAVREFQADARDRVVVRQIVKDIDASLRAQKPEDAYKLFSPKFAARVPVEEFRVRMNALNASPYLGKIKSVDWNGMIQSSVDPMTRSRMGHALIDLNMEKATSPSRYDVMLREYDGKWLIEDMPALFPVAEPQGPPGGPGGPGMPGPGR